MKTKLNIDGMSCDHCVRAVTGALEAIAGVHTVQVSLKSKSAEVGHDETVTLATLKEAVTEAGFSA
ncbi:MAG: cation transporter [Spirochaetaceae bacterium]|jgi:copper ion binding protein|nr:cation transporter [Spirochaetaceae bacterium]